MVLYKGPCKHVLYALAHVHTPHGRRATCPCSRLAPYWPHASRQYRPRRRQCTQYKWQPHGPGFEQASMRASICMRDELLSAQLEHQLEAVWRCAPLILQFLMSRSSSSLCAYWCVCTICYPAALTSTHVWLGYSCSAPTPDQLMHVHVASICASHTQVLHCCSVTHGAWDPYRETWQKLQTSTYNIGSHYMRAAADDNVRR